MNSTSIPKSVLIICLGNICRSPAAEYFLRHYATQSPFEKIQNIEFKSAGLLGGPGPMYRNSRKYLNNKGIPHNEFTSKTVTIEMLENSDLIFVLEKYMKTDLLKILDGKRQLVKDRIYTLKEAVGKSGDIEDPYGMKTKDYNSILEVIENLCKRIIKSWEISLE